MMRTLATFFTLVFATLFYGSAVILADLVGMKKGPGTLFDRYPRNWANALLRVAGVKVVVHNPERMHSDRPLVFAANHVSWFDVLAMASVLPHYSFIAKAELFRIPIFGRGARAVGTIPIERQNRKAAFVSYEEAADTVKGGACIVVYPGVPSTRCARSRRAPSCSPSPRTRRSSPRSCTARSRSSGAVRSG